MIAAMVQPLALAALYVWTFGVLSAAQLTIRLIMAFNVWVFIWPAQKIALGIVDGDADAKAAAGRKGMVFSRLNTLPALLARKVSRSNSVCVSSTSLLFLYVLRSLTSMTRSLNSMRPRL